MIEQLSCTRLMCIYVCVCNADLSNLLVMRKGVDRGVQRDSLTLNLTQLRFHQIKDKEIVQVMKLNPLSTSV